MPDPKKEIDPREENNVEMLKSLSEWSKWLIAINFSAVTGCIIELKSKGLAGSDLKTAIFCFSLNVILSVIITFLFAIEFEPFWNRGVQWVLGTLQFLLFVVALYYFFSWVF